MSSFDPTQVRQEIQERNRLFRHDFGTKLLRETGNLKLVQRALNHSDIKTTARYYAHVLDADVAEAMERVQHRQASPSPPRKNRAS